MAVRGASEQITQAALTWDGVQIAPHRFGGVEFRLGRREIGHIHGDSLIDIPFPTRIQREVVAAGLAEPHHLLPDSGWVSVYIRESADIERATRLLHQSYELARRQKGQP